MILAKFAGLHLCVFSVDRESPLVRDRRTPPFHLLFFRISIEPLFGLVNTFFKFLIRLEVVSVIMQRTAGYESAMGYFARYAAGHTLDHRLSHHVPADDRGKVGFGDRSETVPSMIDRLRQNIVNDFGTLMPKSRAMR